MSPNDLADLSGVRVGNELARLCLLAAEASGNVGPLLRELRTRRGLTQANVEAMTGVPAGVLSRIETGVCAANPGQMRAIARWARAAYGEPENAQEPTRSKA